MHVPHSNKNEAVKIESSRTFHTVTVWLDDGTTWTTSVNPQCTDDQIVDYFLGQRFYSRMEGMDEKLEVCVAVKIQFAPKDEPVRSKSMEKRLKVLRGENL